MGRKRIVHLSLCEDCRIVTKRSICPRCKKKFTDKNNVTYYPDE